MPINIEVISILIWAVPLALLGFLFGAGYLRKLVPPTGCVLMLAGWIMGMATMVAITLSFPVEFVAFIGRVTLERWINQIFDHQPGTNVIYVNPWLLLIGVIVVLSVIASIIYDRMMRPRKLE